MRDTVTLQALSQNASADTRQQDKGQEDRDPMKWREREIELEDGTKTVGFWIEGPEARVRVELR